MSRMGRLVMTIVLGVAAIVGWTMMQPVITTYQVKVAARISCNQMIREVRTGSIGTPSSGWQKFFITRVRADTGLQLKPEDIEFSIDGKENPFGNLFCNAKVRVTTSTEWVGISELIDLPPYKVTKVMRLDRQKAAAGF